MAVSARGVLVGVVIVAACAAAGWAAIYVPWRMTHAADPNVNAKILDGMKPISLLPLALIGLVAGFAAPRRWWIWGWATMVWFVLKIPIDIVRDPTSHNLFPFEVAIYGFLALPAVIGSFAGSRLRRRAPPTPPAA